MAIKTNVKNLDEVIVMMSEIYNDFGNRIHQIGLDEKVGKILANADNADSRFKRSIIVGILERSQRFNVILSYLQNPVTNEGMAECRSDGVYLNDQLIPDSARVEYYRDDEWYYGNIKYNDSGIYEIRSWNGNAMVTVSNGLRLRIR